MANWRTPRRLADQAEVRRRLGPEQLFAPHVARLNRIVEELRQLPGDGTTVSWFDPGGAGIHGRLLVLARDPSRVAHNGTGLISPDNPDHTADNMSWLRDEAGLEPGELTHYVASCERAPRVQRALMGIAIMSSANATRSLPV